jgi:hypothetical protein
MSRRKMEDKMLWIPIFLAAMFIFDMVALFVKWV